MGKVEEMVEEKVEVLKPCPLCGSNDLLLKDFAGWELFCCNCELSLVLADDPTRDGVVARWNDRSNTLQRAERAASLVWTYMTFNGQGRSGAEVQAQITDIITAEFEK